MSMGNGYYLSITLSNETLSRPGRYALEKKTLRSSHQLSTVLKLTTNSNTNVSVSLVWTISCRVTMLACFSSLSRDASLIAVNGAPSSSCSLISFKATTCCVKLGNRSQSCNIWSKHKFSFLLTQEIKTKKTSVNTLVFSYRFIFELVI